MNSASNKTSTGAGWFGNGLGWFSIALGLIGIFAPRRAARLFGTHDRPLLFRLIGLREIASGIGILTGRQKSGWLWSRVGGDAVDLALLGSAARERKMDQQRLGFASSGIAGIAILDTLGALLNAPSAPVHAVKSVTVDRSPEELYSAWRDFTNLPHFMENLEAVHILDDRRSHWVAKGPAGSTVEWDAEITEDIPDTRISWQSTHNADVENSGSVQFSPAVGGRGTVVRVTLDYTPPAGKIGATMARLFGKAPEQEIDVDLHRFEQWMETGMVTVTEGQPTGRSRSRSEMYDVTTSR